MPAAPATHASYAARSDAFRCDECGLELVFPAFCDGCGADFPERRHLSPFALVGLPAQFGLDEEVVDEAERRLTQRLHPDRFGSRGERLQRRAQIAQSAANDAIRALREPFSRAEALLRLQGGPASGSVPLERAFLTQQLLLQEEIADGAPEIRRRALGQEARQALKALTASVAAGFEAGDLTVVRGAIDRSRYWKNLAAAARPA